MSARRFLLAFLIAVGVVTATVVTVLTATRDKPALRSDSPIERAMAATPYWGYDTGWVARVAVEDRSPLVRASARRFNCGLPVAPLYECETSDRVRAERAYHDSGDEFALNRRAAAVSNRQELMRMLLAEEPWRSLPATVNDTNDLAVLSARGLSAVIRREADSRLWEMRRVAAAGTSNVTADIDTAFGNESAMQRGAIIGWHGSGHPEWMLRLALEDDSACNRLAAVEKLVRMDRAITSEVLARVAMEDESPEVRLKAVGGVAKQSLLAEIALGAEDSAVRQAAAQRLTDKTDVQRVFRESRDPRVLRVLATRQFPNSRDGTDILSVPERNKVE